MRSTGHEPELFTEVWSWGSRVLGLQQPVVGHREQVVTA
jgi:hypothetical protein